MRAYGNVVACVAHLMGMAYEELRPHELAVDDPRFPLVVTVRAVKAVTSADRSPPVDGSQGRVARLSGDSL